MKHPPLHLAVALGNVKAAEEILNRHNIDVNQPYSVTLTDKMVTPLELAVENIDLKMVGNAVRR
ncbi:hypothetical protein [Cardinium endosymbiont of Nabis limbatus]|uniref:hypothetical protein n=1 Tax=Cardinium endosymbiont of Nabis limbatus TaxID=3066217 RepID=UPI003AF3ED1D